MFKCYLVYSYSIINNGADCGLSVVTRRRHINRTKSFKAAFEFVFFFSSFF